MKTGYNTMVKKNFKKMLIPAILFVVFGVVSYCTFNYITAGKKHIDGTGISRSEKWIVATGFGIIGFSVGKLFTGNSKDNEGGEDSPDTEAFPFGAF